MMDKTNRTILLGMAILTLGIMSCNKNVYDEEKHEELIRYLSPVDSVDQRHEWKLSTTRTYTFSIDAGSDIKKVMLLTGNPLADRTTEIMTQREVGNSKKINLSASVPYILTTLYAALVDGEGNYYVTSLSPETTSVSFVDATVGTPLAAPTPMTFTYLFEENFPEAGDYDYNDLVLRISQERTGEKEITFRVTLAAVGADRQIACAIRLIGYRFQDIDSVKTPDEHTFNEKVPDICYNLIHSSDLLIEGQNKEALINLFAHAQFATGDDLVEDYGLYDKKKYNVTREYTDKTPIIPVQTKTFIVYFKNSTGLNSFTIDMIDPFIVTEYNGSKMETHLDEYRDAQTLYEYNVPKFKDLPWALRIPSSYFSYPLEGSEIGFKKNGYMFGAYMTKGHSFGEWAEDHQNYLDWYLYPTSSEVWD
jgi:LruC domain-containing protein